MYLHTFKKCNDLANRSTKQLLIFFARFPAPAWSATGPASPPQSAGTGGGRRTETAHRGNKKKHKL